MFASELKALVATGMTERRLDWQTLDMYLELGGGKSDRFLGYFTRLPDAERNLLYVPDIRAALNGRRARDRFRELHEKGHARHGLDAGLYLDYKTYLPDDILALSDRLSMAHSLEIRVPFVNHQLVDRVFPLPDRLKVALLRTTHLSRRALKPRLPAAHFRAPKRGFVGPATTWLREELRQMLLDELSPERLRRLGHFDARFVAGLLDDHFSRRRNRDGILWELLTFSAWHAIYVDEVNVPAYAGKGI